MDPWSRLSPAGSDAIDVSKAQAGSDRLDVERGSICKMMGRLRSHYNLCHGLELLHLKLQQLLILSVL